MKHVLKIDNKFAKRIISREKNFEIRLNDRDFQTGDSVELYPNIKQGETLACELITADIAYIHQDGYGMAQGYVVLALKNIHWMEVSE